MVIRGGLGLLAALVMLGTLFAHDPTAFFAIGIVIQPLISNTRPPPLAQDQFTGTSRLKDVISRNLSTSLQQRFPAGSSEAVLMSALRAQGFRPYQLAPDQGRCLPEYEQWAQPDVHTTRARCDAYDPHKTYEYSWVENICGSHIVVWWTTDEDGKLLKVTGAYDRACP